MLEYAPVAMPWKAETKKAPLCLESEYFLNESSPKVSFNNLNVLLNLSLIDL